MRFDGEALRVQRIIPKKAKAIIDEIESRAVRFRNVRLS